VRDAIVEPAIGRDLLALGPVRRPALLRQVFGVCVTSPAQIVSLQKLQGQLEERGALETIAHYLHLLEEALLVASLPKHARRAARQRAAPSKLITLNQALLAVADPAGVPEFDRDPPRFGAWIENACLSLAWNAEQRVAYWREEPLEVDAVLDGSWGRWAIEVTTGRATARELRSLGEFVRRFPEYRPLVICQPNDLDAAERLGTAAMSWQDFLWQGPPQGRQ
jgi:predicted AAA+ superfamily ATPase